MLHASMTLRDLFSAELVLGLRWVELVTALFMTGLIWFVQVVHYPLLARVGSESTAYQIAHMKRTTGVVAVPMLAELTSGVVLAALGTGPAWQRWPATVLLAVVWLATLTLLVPAHDALARGFDGRIHRRLVAANWLRTVAWTLRSALCIAALSRRA
jgi:hypothetical protein